jgi:aspartate carbamoyltransferase catalytic subunit
MNREEGKFYGRNLVDVHSMTKDELGYILEKADWMKKSISARAVDEYKLAKGLDMIAALLFYEASTRTRTSFEIAAWRLGIKGVGFAGTEGTSVQKGESLTDTVDMYDSYDVDAVVLRHPLDGAAMAVSQHLLLGKNRVLPTFNGGDGMHEHPTQSVLDAFTIKECCGRLEDLDIGIVGDAKYGRTTHSLPILMGLYPNNRWHIFTHEILRMPPAVLKKMDAMGVAYKEYFESGEQLRQMLPKLDFLYATRLQRERFFDDAEFYRARDMFFITADMIKDTKPGFGLGHPLPEDKKNPIMHDELKKGHPKYWCKRQAGNGVPTRAVEMALSLGLLGFDFNGQLFVPKNPSEEFYTERNPDERKKTTDGSLDIRPIENGTVIDHVERDPYVIDRIAQLLRCREDRNVYRAGVVEPRDSERRGQGVVKGVLMIKDRHLTDAELRLIATIAPGATINDISGRKVVRKRDLTLPDMVEGLPEMQCTNERCITRPEHSERVKPKVMRLGADADGLVKCMYCDNLMESHRLFYNKASR